MMKVSIFSTSPIFLVKHPHSNDQAVLLNKIIHPWLSYECHIRILFKQFKKYKKYLVQKVKWPSDFSNVLFFSCFTVYVREISFKCHLFILERFETIVYLFFWRVVYRIHISGQFQSAFFGQPITPTPTRGLRYLHLIFGPNIPF